MSLFAIEKVMTKAGWNKAPILVIKRKVVMTHFTVLIGLGSKFPSASTEVCFSKVEVIRVSK